uniref:T6SS Phospholipase effector Tle1-like catalytic domain-containing protein n=1 Tax=Rhodopseudomonas palustris (strain BisA53) TaxID=316055 RepID=Q07NP8_RHOP5
MARRIILLSDGTGNSSAAVWRTNVWRMYNALDLTNDDQVASYDDGVGTSNFKPLAILGGAFGYGLRRNVINLYKFACRNFKAEGDEIFAFGFSRGAFTIRVTIGLILDQGLISAADISESELDKQAQQAYNAYHKRRFHTNWGLMWRAFKGLLNKGAETQTQIPPGREMPVIRFLGLWDTVAAYGLPIDEMTKGVSQWLTPLELPNHTLSPLVKRACHALSLDDERTTFHPVLWNERSETPPAGTPRYTKNERLSQVWFAGVHANVGGGYPEDSLAHIPLYWIMEEARACGLRFKGHDPDAIAETRQARDKDGRLYDSRSGLASYYRYGPRRVSRLCNQQSLLTGTDEVFVAKPKIHESVLKRVRNNAHAYAPIGIPHDYEVVVTVPDPSGEQDKVLFRIDELPAAASPAASSIYELRSDAEARVLEERSKIWPVVWIRLGLYFLTLASTIVLLLYPFTGRSDPLGERVNTFKYVSDFIRLLAGFLPGWASDWLVAYAQYPKVFIGLAIFIGALVYASTKAEEKIVDRMARLWKSALAHSEPVPSTPPAPPRKLVVVSAWKDYVAPALSAVVIVWLLVTVAWRSAFVAFDQAGYVCQKSDHLRYIPDAGALISFKTSDACFATGYRVGRLDRYLVWTNPTQAELAASSYKDFATDRATCSLDPAQEMANGSTTATARGYSLFNNEDGAEISLIETIEHLAVVPLRRYYSHPWFQPIARYGAVGNEVDFLEPDPDPRVKKISEHITPKVSAELFFFLNDTVGGYGNNKGCVSFFIKPSK